MGPRQKFIYKIIFINKMETAPWDLLVEAYDSFWMPCDMHAEPKRYYNLNTHQVHCEACCGEGIKIFRNMRHNVVRISREEARKIGVQVFLSNGHPVVYLKPVKGKAAKHIDMKLCACGRTVEFASTYCCIECYLGSTAHESEVAAGGAAEVAAGGAAEVAAREQKRHMKKGFRAKKGMDRRRKARVVVRSPVY